MRKITILPIALLVISAGLLSGCTDEETNVNAVELAKFVGTWNATMLSGNLSETDIYVFNDGGACTYTFLKTPGSYAINNSKLVVILQTGTTYTYTYEFSDDDIILALTNTDTGVTTTYTKQ